MKIKGLVFDFDGLMIDTEMPRLETWQEIFAAHGFSMSIEDYYKIIGSDEVAYDPAEDLSNKIDHRLTSEEINYQVVEKSQEMIFHQPLLPGVKEIIIEAHRSGMRLGIASSSHRDWIVPLLVKHDIRQYFDIVVTREDVIRTKPNPELYLTAMKELDLNPENGIAFEDSRNGIKAAKAAGLFCIAIPNTLTRAMNLQNADKIVDSFNDLTIEELINFC